MEYIEDLKIKCPSLYFSNLFSLPNLSTSSSNDSETYLILFKYVY